MKHTQVDQYIPKQLGAFGCISEALISKVPPYTDLDETAVLSEVLQESSYIWEGFE